MGAADFHSVAAGKTPSDAFNAAVDEAQYMHGHGGYTGTIAEKHGFVHVPIPKGVTFATFEKLMEQANEFYFDASDDVLRNVERYGTGARKKYRDKTLKQWQAEVARAKAKQARFWASVRKRGPEVEGALRKALSLAGFESDKWGPALCLGPLTGKAKTEHLRYAVGAYTNGVDRQLRLRRGHKLFVFMGLASS